MYRIRETKHCWIMLFEDRLPATFISYIQREQKRNIMDRPMAAGKALLPAAVSVCNHHGQYRDMSMLIVRVLRGALKIRYLVLGGAIGGGVTLQNMYQNWVKSLPDLSWMDKYVPNNEDWVKTRKAFLSLADNLKKMEIDPELRGVMENKFNSAKDWFDKRLEEAYIAAAQREIENNDASDYHVVAAAKNAISLQAEDNSKTEDAAQKVSHVTQEDLWEIQMKYQKELERLERENKELRRQILLRGQTSQLVKKVKTTLIDMYSDVLDELSDYDASYETQDHLPRVVVIGDQSSGKTSVLEMIAQARIFPRGAGEMMTRAPVKVTLSEGPYHIAQFKDSAREFDLTKEQDLGDLRREVELRMRNLVASGKTVSNDVISMTVKGPGLQRMVLVDLPGIISTNTLGMAEDTKEAIYRMTKHYMSNPNAIILCIQDGSVDAERSNVTDLVAQMDPKGKRTIFVLTKVDLAEENLANPNRIKKILAGELFPMKALGYFAVVTGRGAKNESIVQIRDYEERFFRNSKLFGTGKAAIKSSQMTTRNLSLAVSECFWKMVRETVEQQADAFKAQRFNLETEWKNKFPRMRILDRNQLFEKARGEILDQVINLGEVSVKTWEDHLMANLWGKVSSYVFENIYLTAAQSKVNDEFNTRVDILLSQWAEQQLPDLSLAAGWETLQEEFKQLIHRNKCLKDHDDIFDNLKEEVVKEALNRHRWEDKARDILRVLQLNTLQDQAITDKNQWDSAVKFLEISLKEKLRETEKSMREMLGPSAFEKWTRWRNATEEQKARNSVKGELEKILYNDPDHRPSLSDDELTTVRNTLQRVNVTCDNSFIADTWALLYRKFFLSKTLEEIPYFSRGYYLYKQGIDSEEYSEVILYWRIQQMLRVTVNSLRQQIVNREAHRIDEEIKDVLEDFSRDDAKKEALLTGRRVTLAEELKRVKQIQEKLEEFIKALNKEKLEISPPRRF